MHSKYVVLLSFMSIATYDHMVDDRRSTNRKIRTRYILGTVVTKIFFDN